MGKIDIPRRKLCIFPAESHLSLLYPVALVHAAQPRTGQAILKATSESRKRPEGPERIGAA